MLPYSVFTRSILLKSRGQGNWRHYSTTGIITGFVARMNGSCSKVGIYRKPALFFGKTIVGNSVCCHFVELKRKIMWLTELSGSEHYTRLTESEREKGQNMEGPSAWELELARRKNWQGGMNRNIRQRFCHGIQFYTILTIWTHVNIYQILIVWTFMKATTNLGFQQPLTMGTLFKRCWAQKFNVSHVSVKCKWLDNLQNAFINNTMVFESQICNYMRMLMPVGQMFW